jgi:hypothetical protein
LEPQLINVIAENKNEKMIIGEIKFFTWWWKDEEIRKGLVSKDSSPKNEYVEMQKWEYDYGEGGSVYPDKFDISFSIKNPASVSQTFSVQVLASYKIENIRKIRESGETSDKINSAIEQNSKKPKTLEELLLNVPWTKEKEIFSQNISLTSSSEQKVTVKDFDIGNILNEYYEQSDMSWPWRMKVMVLVKKQNGTIMAKAEKVLEIIPGD